MGAGLGEGIANTRELKVLSYDEAMERPDKEKWDESVGEEHKRMEDNGVFEVVPITQVPVDADVIDSTWAMKKKASGVYHDRLAARGFKQRAGVSYDPRDIMSPVVHEITVRIMLVLMIMALWHAEIIDVKGAFLKASFDPTQGIHGNPKRIRKILPQECPTATQENTVRCEKCCQSILVGATENYGLSWTATQQSRPMPLLHLACGVWLSCNIILD